MIVNWVGRAGSAEAAMCLKRQGVIQQPWSCKAGSAGGQAMEVTATITMQLYSCHGAMPQEAVAPLARAYDGVACGMVLHRDWSAARNIRDQAL